jgi:hypothetical protein
MVKVYLHAGLPKTGTTTIQNWLMENALNLGKEGIFTFPDSGFAHRLAVATITLPKRLSQPDIPAIITGWRLEDATTALAQARDDPDINLILLSSEYFSEADPAAVKITFSNLSLADVAVIFVLRRQDRLLESGYSQSVKEMAWTNPLRGPHYNPNYDWHRLASTWAAVFGQENIILRSYEEIVANSGPLIPMVLKDIDETLSAFANEHSGDDKFANPSLPAGLIEFKRLANLVGAADVMPILEAASERGIGGPRFRFDRPVAKAWLDRYRDSNRRLAREFLNREDDFFDERDLSEGSPGADYTGKLPAETIAMLLALFMQHEQQVHRSEANRAENLAREIESGKAGLSQSLETLRRRLDEVDRLKLRDAEEARGRLLELSARLEILEQFVSFPRGRVSLLWKHLVSTFKRG